MPALAITNHGHCNSYVHAHLYAKELNKAGQPFKFLPGCELYVHPDLKEWRQHKAARDQDPDSKEPTEHGSTVENEDETKSNKFFDPIKRRHHLVVLARDGSSLQKLFGVVSRGYLEGFYKFPRVDYGMLKEHKGQFVVSTACIGGPIGFDTLSAFPRTAFDELVPSLLDDPAKMQQVMASTLNTIDRITDAVGRDSFFLELQFNKLGAQHLINRALIEAHRRTGIPLIVTADSHYCRPDVWKEREIYKKLGWMNYTDFDPNMIPKSVSDLKAELYPKNARQIWDSYKETTKGYDFYDDQLVCDAIERTHDIAFQMIGDVKPDTSIKLPSWSVPKGKTADEALREACLAGMKALGLDGSKSPWDRKNSLEEYATRLDYELEVIRDKQFAKYFLTMKAIVDIASDHMLMGCGRGSAAGSLVNYVLGVTQVDPLKYNLIFERFVNRQRVEYPDIDSDFADRDLLIRLLKKKFGETNVIPISNYNTFQLKSLVKDVSRFFHREEGDGLDFQSVNAVLLPLDDEVRCKVLKQGDDKNLFELKLDDCMKHSSRFKQFMDKHPEVAGPIKTLLHENKALGKHAGGVVIGDDVKHEMPLILSRKEPQTPWVEGMHFKHLNEMGVLKVDLLGLETLRIIQRCIELILKHQGSEKPTFAEIKAWYDKYLHPDNIDLDDEKVYQVYEQGKFAGLFQFTAKGAQLFIQKVRPKNIIDVATATSIYRPGPLTAKVDDIYIDAKNDPGSVIYEHPLVKQVLEKTYGCIIFQEQLMELGHVVGGLTLEECDKLRKVITKRSVSGASKAKEDALKLEKKFIAGAVSQGLAEQTAKDLFEKMSYFSGYGFNASHAVSYAIDSYMCAWLLTYYEPEWLCAYMETQDGQPDSRAKAISELRSFGYEIVKVDINHATDEWTIMPGKRFMPSLLSIKALGSAGIEELQLYRPYRTVDDLLYNPDGTWRHSKFNKRSLENLIRIGAFDSMGIVGEGKVFRSYHHMWRCLIEDNAKLKHRKTGKQELQRRIKELWDTSPEWPKDVLIKQAKEIVGSSDLNLIISPAARDWIEQKLRVRSIDEFESKGIYWFIVDELTPKVTKNGKGYMLITAIGMAGKRYRIYCWGFDPNKHRLAINEPYIAELDSTQFGFSTQAFRVRRAEEKKVH